MQILRQKCAQKKKQNKKLSAVLFWIKSVPMVTQGLDATIRVLRIAALPVQKMKALCLLYRYTIMRMFKLYSIKTVERTED